VRVVLTRLDSAGVRGEAAPLSLPWEPGGESAHLEVNIRGARCGRVARFDDFGGDAFAARDQQEADATHARPARAHGGGEVVGEVACPSNHGLVRAWGATAKPAHGLFRHRTIRDPLLEPVDDEELPTRRLHRRRLQPHTTLASGFWAGSEQSDDDDARGVGGRNTSHYHNS
jgi:hypothetical protein